MSNINNISYVQLNNGNKMPQIGIGTWQITDKETIKAVIESAYESGYRLIDTAAAYTNEMAIGKVLEANLAETFSREELFISGKVWNTNRGYESAIAACNKSIKKLKASYLDMYLIHWPASMAVHEDWATINAETWRGLETLYNDGSVKNIGVCNYTIAYLEELKKTAKIIPAVNQIELHPGMPQFELLDYCKDNGIVVEASSPLGNGQILLNEDINAIAENCGKTPAQICIRWIIQKGCIAIPKTTSAERLIQNMDVFDFELSEKQMSIIDNIPYCGGIGIDPETTREFD